MFEGLCIRVPREMGDDLPLVEFYYNNSCQSTNKMALFEGLYRRRYRTLLCESYLYEALMSGPELI